MKKIALIIVFILSAAISAAAISLSKYNPDDFLTIKTKFRSGAPDEALHIVEYYHNTLQFPEVDEAESYNILRNGELVAVIEKNFDGSYSQKRIDGNGNLSDATSASCIGGTILFNDIIESAPANLGEEPSAIEFDNMLITDYAVTFNAEGSQYQAESSALYLGETTELFTNLEIAGIQSNSEAINICFTWRANSRFSSEMPVESYKVYRDCGDGYKLIATTNGQSYTDTYSGEAATLKYYVASCTAAGEFNSIVVGARYEGSSITSGVENIDTLSDFNISVYPNPATDQITIKGADGYIKLTNASGAVVASTCTSGTEPATINVSSLATGIYFINTKYQNAVKILIK